MDLKAKSWVGNMYHKFENFCSDVEQAMSQDTVKYVENQVHTVGVRVKKFCSGVMQDIRSESSIRPVKLAADFSLEKKPKCSLKEHHRVIDEKFMEDTQVIKSGGKSKHEGAYKRRGVGATSNSVDIDPPMKMARTTSFSPSEMRNRMVLGGSGMAADCMNFFRGSASRERAERICDHISDANMPTVGTSKDVAASEKKISEQKPEDSVFTSSFHGTHMNDDAISQADSGTSSNTIGNEPVDGAQNFETDKLKKPDGIQQAEVETVEQIEGSSQLVETCVMVEDDKLHVPHGPFKQMSCKNKIWDAFSSQRRLTVKEYQQLAALYASNAEADDSEWELL